jgi:hypothetical protein
VGTGASVVGLAGTGNPGRRDPTELRQVHHSSAWLREAETVLVTGSWTRVEVAGTLVRAAWARRGVRDDLLRLWEADHSSAEAPVTVVSAPQSEVEARALRTVREHGLRAMGARHVATASMLVPELAAGEPYGFATRDGGQAAVARQHGFRIV